MSTVNYEMLAKDALERFMRAYRAEAKADGPGPLVRLVTKHPSLGAGYMVPGDAVKVLSATYDYNSMQETGPSKEELQALLKETLTYVPKDLRLRIQTALGRKP